MKRYGASVRGIGVSLPKAVIKNDDLAQLVETNDEWIVSRTGFKERHVVEGNEILWDLSIESSKNALAFAGIEGSEVDLIIHASSTPDYIYPQGCGVVQQAIGATKAFGFDMVMGCSGLIYAMNTAIQFLQNGTIKTALVIGSDTHSRYTDWYDRNTCVLFGDGAGAFVLTRTEPDEANDVLAIDFHLDGGRGEQIKLPINRDNCPLVKPHEFEEKSAIYMNGREVFKFAVGEVPKYIERAVASAGLSFDDLDHIVLHQANARIMSAMSERLNVPVEKMVLSVENYGNTSAASIPLALNDALTDGIVQPGQKLVLCGFGAGLAIATVVLNWTAVDHRKLNAQSAQNVASQSQTV